ncbi:MAG TPA: nicotinate-nucleotide--dimethylbenzimidazole phosphoribosyltransferase [Solirubrobacteraceae bacterium]|nr:nicotinate-nucleotide--dimethylbenzimidazole phosphoribosyltransferase [Solirubrobacteraceae bacterium]
MSLERPRLPADFDDSRAAERRADPTAQRLSPEQRAGVFRAIAERRDIRRFRPDPIEPEVLTRLLEAAHRAPSVGLSQPWRFIVVRSEATKAAMQGLAARERLIQADALDQRARQLLDLKLEGIREAPLSLVVCCDREPDREILGRHTIADADLYSTCLAIQNLWLAARAEGVGVGWVSFYREDDLRALLGIPGHVVPVAWLCVGYPDERPQRPGLEAQGWSRRNPLEAHVYAERWGATEPGGDNDSDSGRDPDPDPNPAPAPDRPPAAAVTSAPPRRPAGPPATGPERPAWWRELAGLTPADQDAAIRLRDAADELVKPAGSLGVLESTLERWAAARGAAPPRTPHSAILVLAGDHGVADHRVSLFPRRVSAQVAAAAARGETAVGVLARALGATLVVADLGLSGPAPEGVVNRRVGDGSADLTVGPALDPEQLCAAVRAGYLLGDELAAGHDLLVLGEIGIANTTVASALLAGLTGWAPELVCGRGTGVDTQGVEHKRAVVAAALAANAPDPHDPLAVLAQLGGFEFAGMIGAMLAAARRHRPVLLDGFAVGVAALAACRLEPTLRDYLIAGHRSAEPAHALVLTELGLEPLLDLRLRLGEASGAALALPLLALTARLQAEMSRFAEAGVSGPVSPSA